MTDVPGVLRDKNDVATKFAELSIRQTRNLVAEGVIAGGMIPKCAALGWGRFVAGGMFRKCAAAVWRRAWTPPILRRRAACDRRAVRCVWQLPVPSHSQHPKVRSGPCLYSERSSCKQV
jgi:hypothetical protein